MDDHIDLLVNCFTTQLNLFATFVRQQCFYENLFQKTGLAEYEKMAKEAEELANKEKTALIKLHEANLRLSFEAIKKEHLKALD